MRVLLGEGDASTLEGLESLYAVQKSPWLRATMVTTVDGAATGAGGISSSINNAADQRVYRMLRSMVDAIVVGSGTVGAEGYRPTDRPIVVVSGQGTVPETLRGAAPGLVRLATVETAPGLAAARAELGESNVYVAGESTLDLRRLVELLHADGLVHLLSEGGPSLLGDLFRAGLVDELCATVVPTVEAGDGSRIVTGPAAGVPLRLMTLLEQDGTLLGRWLVSRP